MLQRQPTWVDEKNAAAAPLCGVFHEQTQLLEHEGERASCRDQLEQPLFAREQCLRSSPLLDVHTLQGNLARARQRTIVRAPA